MTSNHASSTYSFISSCHLSLNLPSPSFVLRLARSSCRSSLTEGQFPYPLKANPHQPNPLYPALSPQSHSDLIASITSDHLLYLHTSSPSGLQFLHTLRGHDHNIQAMAFHSGSKDKQFPHLLVSGDDSGAIKLWDTRTAKCVSKFCLPGRSPALSLALSGTALLAGSEGKIFHFDLAKNNLVQTFDEFLTGEISSLLHYPAHAGHFFCGGSGNDINLFSIKPPAMGAEEDANPLATYMCDSEVRRMGVFGRSNEYLYSISSSESLCLWNIESAEPVAEFLNVREPLAHKSGIHIDYLLDGHYIEERDMFLLAAGNNNGSLALFHVSPTAIDTLAVCSSLSTVDYYAVQEKDVNVSIEYDEKTAAMAESSQQREDESAMMDDDAEAAQTMGEEANKEEEALISLQGHTACIRDIVWCDSNPSIISGGQDGKLCQWSNDPALQQLASQRAKESEGRQAMATHKPATKGPTSPLAPNGGQAANSAKNKAKQFKPY